MLQFVLSEECIRQNLFIRCIALFRSILAANLASAELAQKNTVVSTYHRVHV